MNLGLRSRGPKKLGITGAWNERRRSASESPRVSRKRAKPGPEDDGRRRRAPGPFLTGPAGAVQSRRVSEDARGEQPEAVQRGPASGSDQLQAPRCLPLPFVDCVEVQGSRSDAAVAKDISNDLEVDTGGEEFRSHAMAEGVGELAGFVDPRPLERLSKRLEDGCQALSAAFRVAPLPTSSAGSPALEP